MNTQLTYQSIQDRIRGSLWGAVLGDVIGAFLEFSRGIDQAKIKQSFNIKGGGVHRLQPGQPTDDSELGFAVSKGLIRGKGQLNVNYIAQQMGNWFSSKPIDVGGTIRKSVPKACNMKTHQAHVCRKAAKQCSKQSQSNGTLMSLTPLALWCHRLSAPEIIKAVRQYTILIHSNDLVVFTNSFYTLMLTYLINNAQENGKVRISSFEYAKQQMSKNTPGSQIKKQFESWVQAIQKCFQNPENLFETVNPIKKSGWVRVAFSYAVLYLIKGKQFKQTIMNILRLKGDTDTNACIGGGLAGAYYGFSRLGLLQQVQTIKKWRPKVVKRPDWLVPGVVVQKIIQFIIESSPKQLKIIGGQSQQQK